MRSECLFLTAICTRHKDELCMMFVRNQYTKKKSRQVTAHTLFYMPTVALPHFWELPRTASKGDENRLFELREYA